MLSPPYSIMPSKFLVPLEVPDYQGVPVSSTADPGFVLAYIKYGWWTKYDGTAETDLVLQRPLEGFTEIDRYANPVTAADTVLGAIEKIQRSLSTLKLTGDVTGTAQYAGGELFIETTGGGGIDCTELLNCQVIVDIQGNITGLDTRVSTLEGLPAASILSTDITNWNDAYSWGDHALAGYLTSYTETDPVFTASAAAGILSSDITNWNTAYGWGNHASAGYLTSFSETDPVFSASAAAGISTGDISNWNTAYGWGDHSTFGYLTSEQDPVFTASVAYNIAQTDIDKWTDAYGWGNHANAGYLTSFVEADTLDSVTTRGNATTNSVTIGSARGRLAVFSTTAVQVGQGGVTGANGLLQIMGGGTNENSQIDLFRGATTAGFLTTSSFTAGNGLTIHGLNGLRITNSGSTVSHFFNDGNLSLGYASPTNGGYRLDVSGSTRVDGVLHMGNASDGRVVIKGFGSDGSIYIGGSGLTTTLTAVRNTIVTPVGSFASLTGTNNTIYGRNSGSSLTSGSGNVFIGTNTGVGITTGIRNVMITSSDATNLPSSLSNSIHIVAGSGYRTNDASTIPTSTHAFIGGGFGSGNAVNDFYFGQMPFTADAGSRLVDIVMRAPSGSGTDIGGAHFTIAAGRGTGTGTPGDIILRTSNVGTTGTTVQTLADRIRIAGATGNVTVSTLAGVGSRMVVADASGVLSTQAIPSGGGSLSAGSVGFGNGTAITENNSKFYWDNVNFRLGINNGAPAFTLDVSGDIRSTTLATASDKMVVADTQGKLTTQPIPVAYQLMGAMAG